MEPQDKEAQLPDTQTPTAAPRARVDPEREPRELRGLQVGIVQIDDKPATSVRFERGDKEGRPTYNVSFVMDGKTVARLKDLGNAGLEEAVGDRNAKTIRETESGKGTLKGSTLATEYGLSPEESARRSASKEERKQAELDRQQPDAPDEKNVVAQESSKLQQVEVPEALARLARIRDLQREERERPVQAKSVPQHEGEQSTRPSTSAAGQGQPANNRAPERQSPEPVPLTVQERDRARQIELMDQVHTQFRVSGAKFHFKDQPQRIAFKDKGSRMVSASNDERVAHAMATMAEAKGWSAIRVSGHPDFQREVWLEGSLRGIEVRGFKPQQKDLDELDTRLDRRSRNVVAYEPEKAGQEPVKASERAPGMPTPQAAPREPQRARQTPPLDHSALHEPPKPYAPSDRAKVVTAVAEAVAERIKNPEQREAVLSAIATRLEALDKKGKVPSVQMYDKAAPSQIKQPEQTRPQVERNAERTR